ncbi:polysaccharide deacetylase family protein [Streptococcus parauberis]|uniref:Polysaccharide deacetylase n=2 Tax=Streptococcus parauberis TaxID=1348 RepID=F1YZC3_9STRE|nr:polysaccharide deacetylase family protein [Streptococcus parauberis]EGE54830.1 polysaccharide deacetylase [Streptococcus parauberis NCFD 2020]EMF49746.1 Polysaccharide deacetylase [Streptococcus parauberis KRS-02109]PCH12260.1 Poly-beta-1,6-N-acetyl-D-glucosamine N-deacetylase precursor [Streptococcus parauberis]PIA85209.1 Poly-beta-1,6-N-acetyl-D-glucosamine N-deacetylase precursor [Streptococcus parauberis]RFE02087.1 Poly-beta-1,6-N-acetyl-D-glucosamine N-deacetylase precursor [Streptococ
MTRRTKRKKNIGLIIIFISIITLFAFAIASFVYLQKTTAKPVDKIKTSQQIKRNKLSNKEKVEWKKESSPIKLPILMYHAIHTMDPSEAPNANLIVDPKVFEEQVKAMADDGYYFLTPEEAYRVLDKNEKPANKVVWLTFDDSMIDFYQIAYPIMKKYKVKATNNVITSYTDEKRVSNLSLEQMTEMKKNGMSFQDHTVNHPDLSQESSESQTAELKDSKTYLDTNLNQETIAVAYPSGRYSDSTLKIAKSLNYKLGVTTNEGLASASDGLLSLNRIRILPSTSANQLLQQMLVQ